VSDTHREHCESSVRSHELLCPQCETAVLTRRHCKTVCDACGYIESCEDNFVRPPNARLQPSDAAG
jgi:hypothetical protein